MEETSSRPYDKRKERWYTRSCDLYKEHIKRNHPIRVAYVLNIKRSKVILVTDLPVSFPHRIDRGVGVDPSVIPDGLIRVSFSGLEGPGDNSTSLVVLRKNCECSSHS